ncbi:MAG TPA: GDSL-type esterase/lipase family protein [Ilumatobacter sp.]|nr:GDSL-type esterase/lipase family protein [Ilumatobacter sp.]
MTSHARPKSPRSHSSRSLTNVAIGVVAAAAVAVAASCSSETTPGPTLVVLGDSLTAPIGNPDQADQDWFTTANEDADFQLIANAGIGGETTEQILARVDQDVIARGPEWATVLAGTNDVFGGTDAQTIITNLSMIYDKLAFTNVGIIAFTIPPILVGDSVKEQTLRDVNAWMRATVESGWANARLVDWSDDLGADGDEVLPNDAYVTDGIHFSAEGAGAAGAAAAPVFESIADSADG